jgi:hypothetical protein
MLDGAGGIDACLTRHARALAYVRKTINRYNNGCPLNTWVSKSIGNPAILSIPVAYRLQAPRCLTLALVAVLIW